MTTSTLGTNANNSIPSAMQYLPTNPIADFATLRNAMFDDGAQWGCGIAGNSGGAAARGRVAYPNDKCGWDPSGLLIIPNRGILRVLPGDWVGVDNRGFPFLVPLDSITNGLWTHNP